MRIFLSIVERCLDTHHFMGYVPKFPGAHSQGTTLDELNRNLEEVIEMLLEDAGPRFESDVPGIFRSMAQPAFVFDGRNILDHRKLFEIGFNVYPLGKPCMTHFE